MIIGIDGNEANVEKKVGISEYAFELLCEFYLNQQSLRKSAEKNQKNTSIFKIYLKDIPRSDLPEQQDWWEYVVVRPGKLWTQIGLPVYLFTHFPRLDVFFTPSHYAPRFSPVPTVIAIMDVAYLRFPELFAQKDLYQLREWTKYSARKAKKIFTISESSKHDILKYYHVPEERVIVTYPGIKKELKSMNMNKEADIKKLKEKFGISENYILFVGTLQPRKNVTRLIEAFAKVRRQGIGGKNNSNLQLVLVGKKGWLYEDILAAPEKFGITDSVKFLDFVSDNDLPALYNHALCYVLPSLYEGFGLPVLEAMKFGCPVITSNISSLPEAGGDAAVYVDPENVDDISEKIQKVIGDEKLRKQMIDKGYKQIKKFSWEKSAKETIEVLEEVARQSNSK